MSKPKTSTEIASELLKEIDDQETSTAMATASPIELVMLTTEILQKGVAKVFRSVITGPTAEAKLPAFLMSLDQLLLEFNDGKPSKGRPEDTLDTDDEEEEPQSDDGLDEEDEDEVLSSVTITPEEIDATEDFFLDSKLSSLLTASLIVCASTEEVAKLSPKQKEYRDFFMGMMEEFEIKSPTELDDDEMAKFFDRIKTGWAKNKSEASLLSSMAVATTKTLVETLFHNVGESSANIELSTVVHHRGGAVADAIINGQPHLIRVSKAESPYDMASLDSKVLACATSIQMKRKSKAIASVVASEYDWFDYTGNAPVAIEHAGVRNIIHAGSQVGINKSEDEGVAICIHTATHFETITASANQASKLRALCEDISSPI